MLINQETLRLLNVFALRTKRSFYGIRQGAHRSPRRGHGIEFAEYRKYEVGDNPRAIDWNLYGRSDKLYIKRYLEEENVSLYIIIDGSRSLTHPALRVKWDLASHIAAYAAYIALSTQDPVTISILGGPHSPSYWGGRAFSPLTTFLTKATSSLVSEEPRRLEITDEARRAATRVTFPGISLVISDFLYPLQDVASLLASFRARNMEVHAIQLLGPEDIAPAPRQSGATLVDSETGVEQGVSLDPESRGLYHTLLTEHTNSVREHCLRTQMSYTLTTLQEEQAPTTVALDTITRMGLFI